MGLFGHDDDKQPEDQGAADNGQTPTSDTPAAPQTGGSDDQWSTPPTTPAGPSSDEGAPGADAGQGAAPTDDAGAGDTPDAGAGDQGGDDQTPPAAPQQ